MELRSKGGVRNHHADVLWKFQIEMERKVALPSDEKIRNKRQHLRYNREKHLRSLCRMCSARSN